MQKRNLARQLMSVRVPIVCKCAERFPTADAYVRTRWLTLQAEDSLGIHPGGDAWLTL